MAVSSRTGTWAGQCPRTYLGLGPRGYVVRLSRARGWSDPDLSMTEIARLAGVVRATIYVHFATRQSLVTAVTERFEATV